MTSYLAQGPARIRDAFAARKVFIPYVVAGDPDLDTTAEVIRAAVRGGADAVEIGIPFSDPTAEGPVITAATQRSLAHGTTTADAFALVEELRKDVTVPFFFMTYAAVVFARGSEQFIRRCAEVGVDGLIIPDIPLEERGEFAPYCEKYGVALVPLVAPTSGARTAAIARAATGFVYVVSSLGVTGMRSSITTDVQRLSDAIHAAADIPCAIGFGISTPEQAAEMAAHADGVIVGSAIVNLVAERGKEAPAAVEEFVGAMTAAIRG